jgi:hypothetical protein
MKLLIEVYKSVKQTTTTTTKKTKKNKANKNPPANWSLTLTWLVGFKPTSDRVLLLTNQNYHS